MIQKREYGIVLKTFLPRKNTITVLDYSAGKIRVLSPSNFAVGSLVSYVTSKTRLYPVIQQVEIGTVPLDINYDDLFFLHHLLEVTYHFIGYADVSPHVYNLLAHLVTHSNIWLKREERYLIVFKLLALLGYYPEDSLFHVPAYYQFVREPLDRIESCSIPNNDIEKIVRWLRNCISNHSDIENFNTLSFLYAQRKS